MKLNFKKQWMKAMMVIAVCCFGGLANAEAQSFNVNDMTDVDAHYYIDKCRVTHAELVKLDMTAFAGMEINDDAEGMLSIYIITKTPKEEAEAPGKVNGITVSQGILDRLDPYDIDALAVSKEGKLIITTKSKKIMLTPEKE